MLCYPRHTVQVTQSLTRRFSCSSRSLYLPYYYTKPQNSGNYSVILPSLRLYANLVPTTGHLLRINLQKAKQILGKCSVEQSTRTACIDIAFEL